MNISAPPTSSRGNTNASRTSSLTNLASIKIPPFHTADSRASSLKSNQLVLDLTHHSSVSSAASSNNTSNPIRALKLSSNSQKSSTSNLLRLSSNESAANVKQFKTTDSGNDSRGTSFSTPKSRTPRSRSLTAESGQKLDEFIHNVKQFQLNQSLTPGYQPKSPPSQKVLSSGLIKALKQLNVTTAVETPNAKSKKRLVKQFYEDPRSSKGSSSLGRTNSLTQNYQLNSPVTPDLVTQNIFNNYDLSDGEVSNTEGKDEQDFVNINASKKTDNEQFTIEREILKLKFEVINEVKSKVNQTEMETISLVNLIELKKAELVELNDKLLSKYEESKPQLLKVSERDFSLYTLRNENIELDNNLNELESNLQKYRDIINNEKSLISEIDDDLEYLEKITLEKLQTAIYNRNRVVISVVVIAVCYLVYFFKK